MISMDSILSNSKMPGVVTEGRPLTIYFLLDVSGSMHGEKIKHLNEAIRKAIPLLKKESEENSANAKIFVRAMLFGKEAVWIDKKPQPIETYEWKDIAVSGTTSMGAAIELLNKHFDELMAEKKRMLAPVVILVSDGNPTDTYKKKFKQLMENKIGRNAIRLAIAIGDDADMETLKEFIASDQIDVLKADQPEEIVKKLVYASIAGSKSSLGNVQLISNKDADKFDA